MRRPVVGVTGPDRGGGAAWAMTALAIRRAGGRPRRISPSRSVDPASLDALVLGGGADVSPEAYREVATSLGELVEASTSIDETGHRHRGLIAPSVLLLRRALARPRARATGRPLQSFASRLDTARDTLERSLLDEAIKRGWPLLAICRGAQLMNVHYGGTLHQSLEAFYLEVPQVFTVLPKKPVAIEPSSRLCHVVGTTTLLVNALHRQAVRTLGRGLSIVGRERSGVVQAIEDPTHPFRIGVQWHPEFIPQKSVQQRLFDVLVETAQPA
ncbi:MAG: gamma-glutamyl-gamma-aminobutyrate hydrolase family protein [Polyangiaceae bacterium]|nr:gamma-glutamyl-gamma-aminobutyrate hydrolase family protein [Polyangiaceae bacterium]